ncbi:hypothetical protein QJQ45_027105, partial [Haematococcus lacustris]
MQTLSCEKCLPLCRPVNAMVTKKRGVMARCAGAQKAREVMAQRRAAEAEAKALAGAAEAETQAQADAGAYEADEAGADEAGAHEADVGAYEAEAQSQADARAYEAQLHQLQPELQQREQQATDTQRLQHLQQQLQDLQQDELQRKEQQVAEQQQQLQQQQADMHLREQQLAEQQHQLQQQQADMHLWEQQLAEQQHQLQQQQADMQQREQQVAQQQQQVQQQQADLQLREQQVAQQQQQVQQQQADLQLREQQVATQKHQVQQQQADLQLREQQVATQKHQVQQQQADLQQREQQVAQQHHQVQLQQQLDRLQQQLEAQSGAELQRQVQQQLAAQQHLLQQQQADLLLKQQQVEKQPQEAAVQQAVSTNHPLPDHSTCSPQVPGSLRSPLFMRPRQDTTIAPMPRLHSVAHALRIPGLPYSEVVGAHQSLLLATAPPPPQPRPAQQAQSNPKQPPPSSPSYLPPPPLHGGTASGLAVRAWGRSLAEYFSAWGMPGDLWVPYAAGRLTGGAEVWWSHQVFNNTPAATCWMAFVGGLCEHYTPAKERAWQPAAQTSAAAKRVHSAAPTVLLTTSNRFAMLPVADEQEQQLPSQPAKLDEPQGAAASIAAAAVAAVLRAAAELPPCTEQPLSPRPVWDLRSHRQQQQQPQSLSNSPQAWQRKLQPLLNEFQKYPVEAGAGLLDRLQQHRRMRSVVSLATGVVPPTPDQVLGGIMVESLRPVLAGIKPAPGGQRSTNQQPLNTALIMTMGRGIEQHGIKRTARQLGITPHAVKRARRSHLSNLAAGAAADWAAAPLRRGRRCLSQEQLEYVRTFFEEHSSPSPMYKDVRRYYMRMTAGSSEKSEVRMSRRYVDRSLKKLYLEYARECPENLTVGSTTFEMLRPPWVKRITAAHKQVCVCIPCESCELQLDQLGKHMGSLVLPEDPQPLGDSDSDSGSDSGGGDGEVHVLLAEHIANADAQDLAGVLDAGALGEGGLEKLVGDAQNARAAAGAIGGGVATTGGATGGADVKVDLDCATVQSWFVCPCKVGAKPRLACLQRQCAACKDRKVGVKAGCEGVQLQYREFKKLDNGQGVELATVHTTLGELVLGFNALMQKQLWHQYLAKHQRATFRAHCAAVRNTPGLVVVSCDWSEKLTIHQDIACQGAYWKQRTMSVFVACAHYQDMAGNYREESVFVSADRCDQSAEASTTALVQVIECLLQGRRHPDGIQGEALNSLRTKRRNSR